MGGERLGTGQDMEAVHLQPQVLKEKNVATMHRGDHVTRTNYYLCSAPQREKVLVQVQKNYEMLVCPRGTGPRRRRTVSTAGAR